ncbi:homocysteine S-methyltransferase family protein [Nocardioides ochotonae]|uniref:homocysteine S-methyltransferase family protein n=1 Tax=Nocardioides ochotonae TaxID=2685869 RepID=UPI00140BA9B2|nr:homocysteine S-methyltransferase family protein [Nocardioides ochotonae]
MSSHSTFGPAGPGGPAGPAPGGLPGARYVSDGGLETDLIFHHGLDLPEFASFPLVDTEGGRALLRDYFTGYAAIARRAGVGLTLETPTWRANPDWGARVGYDAAGLDRANRACVGLLQQLRGEQADLPDVRIIGVVGPRGDGYVAGEVPAPGDAAAYHRPQVAALAESGVDVVASFTFTTVEESLGVVRAARQVGVPVLVGFTVETDGRLPDGTPLGEAVRRTDAADAPDGYLLNCAHPTHVAPALDAGGDWLARVVQLNPNASTQTHAELDEAETLDAGDLDLLVRSCAELVPALPALRVLGGCCGTDTSHVAALWDV